MRNSTGKNASGDKNFPTSCSVLKKNEISSSDVFSSQNYLLRFNFCAMLQSEEVWQLSLRDIDQTRYRLLLRTIRKSGPIAKR